MPISLFSIRSVFLAHTKTCRMGFKIYPLWRLLSKTSVFRAFWKPLTWCGWKAKTRGKKNSPAWCGHSLSMLKHVAYTVDEDLAGVKKSQVSQGKKYKCLIMHLEKVWTKVKGMEAKCSIPGRKKKSLFLPIQNMETRITSTFLLEVKLGPKQGQLLIWRKNPVYSLWTQVSVQRVRIITGEKDRGRSERDVETEKPETNRQGCSINKSFWNWFSGSWGDLFLAGWHLWDSIYHHGTQNLSNNIWNKYMKYILMLL